MMREPAPYERKVAAFYYAATALATVIWHVTMLVQPGWRVHFVGDRFGTDLYWLFVAPDLIGALLLPIWIAITIRKLRANVSWASWLLAGGQSYAFLVSCALAIKDSSAYWGMLGMMFSSATAIMFALRFSGINILWGPFAFRPAPTLQAPKQYCIEALIQTCGMWFVFLLAIPTGIAALEKELSFTSHWWSSPMRLAIGSIGFIFGATLGFFAGRAMATQGEGTPLPSKCTNKLVIFGPYRYVRNPMAVGGILQGVCVGVAVGSPLIVLYALLGAIAWNTLVRPLEEEYLESCFGDVYRDYIRQVSCWIPRLSPISPLSNDGDLSR